MKGEWTVGDAATYEGSYRGLVQDGKVVRRPNGTQLLFVTPMHATHVAEAHNAALREAVEAEREACATLVAGYGIRDWRIRKEIAAAIRARSNEDKP